MKGLFIAIHCYRFSLKFDDLLSLEVMIFFLYCVHTSEINNVVFRFIIFTYSFTCSWKFYWIFSRIVQRMFKGKMVQHMKKLNTYTLEVSKCWSSSKLSAPFHPYNAWMKHSTEQHEQAHIHKVWAKKKKLLNLVYSIRLVSRNSRKIIRFCTKI